MDKNMADRLIELREKNHLSQSAVANRLGVTPALISAYEKTERNPSLERLIALADIYHTSTDYILGRTTTDSYATIIEVKDLTDAQIRILRELVEVMKHTVFCSLFIWSFSLSSRAICKRTSVRSPSRAYA